MSLALEMTDNDLIDDIASGNSTALSLLYDRYGAPVYSLAMRMLHDSQAAEEVVQETFVRVWRQGASYRPDRGAAGTWILSIARNLAIDEQRRRGVRPPSPDEHASQRLAALQSEDEDPSEQVFSNMRHEVVVEALSQLPNEQRTVVELAYFDNLSQREIASHLGDPLGTVKTRMRLGMRKLGEILRLDGARVDVGQ